MPFIQINRRPDERTLRQFGATGSLGLLVAAGFFAAGARTAALAGLSCALILVTWRRPALLRAPFVGLSYATAPIGMVVGELLTAAMFFMVFAPIGLIFKILGRDPLQRGWNRDATSYWTPKRASRAAADYLRQY